MDIDCLIIGGGIVGLMTAREVARAHPGWDIAVLEKSHYFGDGTTGRNSGVLHSGIYYPTESLKHRLCIEGNQLWRQEKNAKILSCGKMIVGDELSDLEARARANKVDYRFANEDELKQLNEYTETENALFIPSTAVVDIASFISEIIYELKVLGVALIVDSKDDEWPTSRCIVNCAGLGAIEVRKKFGLTGFTQKLVKGRWLVTTSKFDAPWLIYPKPLPELMGLGVHSCIDPDGCVRFGPDAIAVTEIDYAFGDEASLVEATLKQFPSISRESLRPSTVGLRTKLVETNDFVVDSPMSGYIECLGIESPGLTAAPAIAKLIVEKYISRY